MSKFKFTPGPWDCLKLNSGAFQVRSEIGKEPQQKVALVHSTLQLMTGKANAHLISASPDLYAALNRAHLEIISLLNEGDFKRHVTLDLGYIVDAIRKAEGRES